MSLATDLATELRHTLESRGEPGTTELLEALQALLGGTEAAGPTIGLTQLKRRVYRLEFGPRSLVLKRSEPAIAELNRLVADRWLPAIGLGDRCAPLLATAAERQGRWVWQIYEDLGDETLDRCPERSRVESAVELVAELHTRAAGHPLLPEVRHHSKDLGLSFFMSNVADAIQGLEALPRGALQPSAKTTAIRDRLLDRLYPALTDAPRRAQVLKETGGPDTLLHGDLWRANAFVT
ncbi:MAG TPA: phosphotransferase, partial [Candidatus Dormibacteraeota bacterium]|nr:phosphotransferase [Candidatus Dormibacteraeota bacterium]